MLNLTKLNDIEYIKIKIQAHLTARRTATETQQKALNAELNILYKAKYKLFEGTKGAYKKWLLKT